MLDRLPKSVLFRLLHRRPRHLHHQLPQDLQTEANRVASSVSRCEPPDQSLFVNHIVLLFLKLKTFLLSIPCHIP